MDTASSTELSSQIKAEALRLGFSAAGITLLSSLQNRRHEFVLWKNSGFAGTMQYMNNFLERQSRLLEKTPDLKSAIVVAAPYSFSVRAEPRVNGADPSSGRIARYAQGRDYHKIVQKKLCSLEAFIRRRCDGAVNLLRSVDKGPFPERVLAEAAGIGFFGKNTCMIRPKGGSFFFLGVILTDLELVPDRPLQWDCGSCSLCLEACPTQALARPYELDARRCIAYLTIENRGDTSEEFRPKMGNWLFGCDLCQQVCPYNRQPDRPGPVEGRTSWPEFSAEAGTGALIPLQQVLALRSEEAFLSRFAGTPILRAKREGLLRNACIAAGNLRDPHLIPVLEETARTDPSQIVRQHAASALMCYTSAL